MLTGCCFRFLSWCSGHLVKHWNMNMMLWRGMMVQFLLCTSCCPARTCVSHRVVCSSLHCHVRSVACVNLLPSLSFLWPSLTYCNSTEEAVFVLYCISFSIMSCITMSNTCRLCPGSKTVVYYILWYSPNRLLLVSMLLVIRYFHNELGILAQMALNEQLICILIIFQYHECHEKMNEPG